MDADHRARLALIRQKAHRNVLRALRNLGLARDYLLREPMRGHMAKRRLLEAENRIDAARADIAHYALVKAKKE